jgi:uncharacterized protein DUF1592/uncharacterized protein DUF1588/uncharacterized protein DUF1585/uncharacterized protein DUF1587/uncharacterized protein DUF1595
MKTLSAATLVTLLLILGSRAADRGPGQEPSTTLASNAASNLSVERSAHKDGRGPIPADALTGVVKQYCQVCHNDGARTGNLSLESFDVAKAPAQAEIAEKMVAKLRAAMMPPRGMPRPGGDTLRVLMETLESSLDAAHAAQPNPGRRTFQRLNRAEYTNAIRELLSLEIDAGDYLPLDTKSDNFDNIADVQVLSPTLLEAYLRAASEISWLAVGNPKASAKEATYNVPRTASQMAQVEGAPFGTRGGLSVVHNFPADGEYAFRVSFYHETTGEFAGSRARGEQLEISIDGERAVLLEVDRWMHAGDPNGAAMATEAVPVKAGSHRVSAAFITPVFLGTVQDLISPLKWSLNSTSNAGAYGFTLLPHLRDLVINGPHKPTGVSDSPVRHRLFSCQPTSREAARGCAESIVSRIATQAFRRPLAERDRTALLSFYDAGAAKGDFESGVRAALEAILASPDFVFRFERAPESVRPDGSYRISDIDLAARLSFFLWSAPPDAQLLTLAQQGKLSQASELEKQVRRMLADPRAETLATRFAAQWLRLSDLEKVQPDVRQYPDFDEQLRVSMKRETELFFHNLVQEDRSVLDLFRADYTFVNDRLAQHYGMTNVSGPNFRRVKYTDDRRRGLLGQASVLTLTSHASRTSAVDRGKWVMEVFLHSPPPPPPPGVPDLEATPGVHEGKVLTVRERMEQHRSSPVCQSCHRMMDPIGLPLEHFDVTGKWRLRDSGMPIDSRSELWDGTPVETPADLRNALLKRQESLLRTFARNLMAYALGRRVEYYDMPAVRAITKQAASHDHRVSSYIMGVVNTPAFRMQKVEVAAEEKSRSP